MVLLLLIKQNLMMYAFILKSFLLFRTHIQITNMKYFVNNNNQTHANKKSMFIMYAKKLISEM